MIFDTLYIRFCLRDYGAWMVKLALVDPILIVGEANAIPESWKSCSFFSIQSSILKIGVYELLYFFNGRFQANLIIGVAYLFFPWVHDAPAGLAESQLWQARIQPISGYRQRLAGLSLTAVNHLSSPQVLRQCNGTQTISVRASWRSWVTATKIVFLRVSIFVALTCRRLTLFIHEFISSFLII